MVTSSTAAGLPPPLAMTSRITSAASALPPLSPTAAWASFYASVAHRLNHLNDNAQQKPYLAYLAKFQELAGPMTSLVADFLVNPVIRHARRLSGAGDAQQPDVAPLRLPSLPDILQEDTPIDDSPFPPTPPLEPHDCTRNPVAKSERPGLVDDAQETQLRDPTSNDISNMTNTLNIDETAIVQDGDDYTPSRAALAIRDLTLSNSADPEPRTPIVTTSEQHGSQTPVSAGKGTPLPEDDGMGHLRKRILSIQSQDLPASEKARLMHQLFVRKDVKSQVASISRSDLFAATERPVTPSDASSWQQRLTQGPLESLRFWQAVLGESAPVEEFNVTDDDKKPTFVPAGPDEDVDDRAFGCQHYMRNVKLQCSTCDRWYTCRFCHNDVEDHELIRKETKNMLCMYCGTAQKAGETCVACGVSASRYYCGVCKLWNNDPDKKVYHCEDCGICRVGEGIGKDFFHCKRCVACIAISTVHDHKCFERATDCDCPICGEYMFTSPKPVVFMKCGHSIHRSCFDDYMHSSYKCPICSKSVVNMEIQFRNLDLAIQAQPMPPELRDTQAVVLCNDCSAKSSVQYHWLGLKCGVCQSYNTAQLQIMGSNNAVPTPAATLNTVSLDTSAAISTTDTTASVARVTTIGFATEVSTASPVDIPNTRDAFRRRRHSSSYTGPAVNGANADRSTLSRLARSESPATYAGRMGGRATTMDIDEEDEEDMLGFWSRIPRSSPSDDEAGLEEPDDSEEESDVDDSDDELEDEDEDDDQGLGFFMPGHR